MQRLKPGGSFDGENYIKGKYEISGRIRVSLEHKKGKLMIHIHNAEELAAADFNGFSDPYVKACLLPDKNKYPRKKTAVKKKTLSPEFNEKMTVSCGMGYADIISTCTGVCIIFATLINTELTSVFVTGYIHIHTVQKLIDFQIWKVNLVSVTRIM